LHIKPSNFSPTAQELSPYFLSPKDDLSPANALSCTDNSPNKTGHHSGYTSKNIDSPHREFKFDVGDNKIEIKENPSPEKGADTFVNFSEAVR
tara:strand:- start:191 stop:469 length:279 start_codon:yes stop_codon:yes gene_type:complete